MDPTANGEDAASIAEEPAAKKLKRSEYRETRRKVIEGSEELADAGKLPQKKFYRQRAHANPFSDHQLDYPVSPYRMDWSVHFPDFVSHAATAAAAQQLANDREAEKQRLSKYEVSVLPEKQVPLLDRAVTVADIGCGFGGLLVALAPRMPERLILGMEIRLQVTDFVHDRIRALRFQQAQLRREPEPSTSTVAADDSKDPADPSESRTKLVPGGYNNVSVIRANAMKFLPNFFLAHSLEIIFLCFPDPHFKARKHKARIVSPTLNDEYAYVLKPGGRVYHVTDVQDLHEWMSKCFREHASFEAVTDDQLGEEGRWIVEMIQFDTEEGKKVERNKGEKFVGVWRCKPLPDDGPRMGVDGVYRHTPALSANLDNEIKPPS